MKIKIALFLMIATSSFSQSNEWNGKKCAVVLTYDDALNVHLDNVIPALDSFGLKGTFYLTAYYPGSQNRIADWRMAAAQGHELGNHTLFHPCLGKLPGRSWVGPEQMLENYSMERLLSEIKMTNAYLKAIDGKTKRTFAYPCGDMSVGGVSYVDKIKSEFVAARGVKGEMVFTKTVNMFDVGSFAINGESDKQLIALVKEAMNKNALVVFLFHGVGGEHGMNVGLKEHSKLLHFLKANEKEIWNATFLEAAEYMQTH